MTTSCECGQPPTQSPAPLPLAPRGAEHHPAAGDSPVEIIDHLLRVHHRSLRQRLLWIESQFGKAAAEHPAGARVWSELGRKLAAWHEDLVCCLLQERCVIFAPVIHEPRRDSPELREAVRAVGKTHAHLLQQLWALAGQVTDAARRAPEHEASEATLAELSDLVEEFCQHLFEEECLLFPQLTAPCPGRSGLAAAPLAALEPTH